MRSNRKLCRLSFLQQEKATDKILLVGSMSLDKTDLWAQIDIQKIQARSFIRFKWSYFNLQFSIYYWTKKSKRMGLSAIKLISWAFSKRKSQHIQILWSINTQSLTIIPSIEPMSENIFSHGFPPLTSLSPSSSSIKCCFQVQSTWR